jgi:hypothetical protein
MNEPLEDKIEFLSHQLMLAEQERDMWKQRAQMNDDSVKYSEDINNLVTPSSHFRDKSTK